MADLFVFGPLRHAPLREKVLGRAVACETARLSGYSVYEVAAKGAPEAVLCQTPGAAAEGVLLRDLSNQDLARLAYYEGESVDVLREMSVTMSDGATVQALARALGCVPDGERLFDLAEWAAEWGRLACGTAREIMAQYGRTEPETMARLRPFLAARAWARELARQDAPHALRSARGLDTVEILRDRPGFEGFFRLRDFDLRFRRFDGSMTETLSREGFVAYDAALVLPYDPETDRVLLIEQLRYGPVLRGDPKPSILEPPAGLVDAGESPEVCALREAEEEAGVQLRELRPMMRVYASPGYTTEFFHCFLGLCELSEADNGLGGLDEEHEDIRSHVIPFERAMALVDSGEVNAGPLVMMLYWLARHREELRRSA
ncbi:NUDIX domain-containing protein [Salipiger abyssi]|uniref:NUDIX domain-containing protein n=1 Tax=Salipiger abyssi TaxID=1250539 RepID=UPI001A8E64DD|nr:NUDIX domain-containing protein [Salipiger abyssi]MBN9886617.1 NUDIX domain-containing protein [Salipiger abyssi]